jgi:hypothetical protein
MPCTVAFGGACSAANPDHRRRGPNARPVAGRPATGCCAATAPLLWAGTPGIAAARMWLLSVACDVYLAIMAAGSVTAPSADEIAAWRRSRRTPPALAAPAPLTAGLRTGGVHSGAGKGPGMINMNWRAICGASTWRPAHPVPAHVLAEGSCAAPESRVMP